MSRVNQHTVTSSGQNMSAQPSGFHQQNQRQRNTTNGQLNSLEALIEEYIVKNKAVVQSQAISLRKLENKIG